jgi:hypothetical protein
MIYCRWWSGCIMTSWCSGSMPRSTTNVMIRRRCRLKRGKRVKPRRWLTCSTSKDRKRAWCGPDRRKVCRASTGPTVHRWRSCSASWSSRRPPMAGVRHGCTPSMSSAAWGDDEHGSCGAGASCQGVSYSHGRWTWATTPAPPIHQNRAALGQGSYRGDVGRAGTSALARLFQTAGRVPVQSARPSHSRTALPGA